MSRPRRARVVILVLALAVTLPATGWPATARANDAGTYAGAVDQALQVLRDAPADDRLAARRAADILEAGTGQSQTEILADLRRDPPDVADARARLTALARADRSPVFAPEPGKAQRAVRDILAQPRYDALRQGPSPWDRVQAALLRLLAWVLSRIGDVVAGGIGRLLMLAALLALGLLAFVGVRFGRWGGRREARARVAAAARGARRDRFADADRLAAAGDLTGAVRELAGGVAAALGHAFGDERAWEASPLTVREIFSRAPDPAALRPLLRAFELATYGGRPPDLTAYRQAAAAAAPFRGPEEAAA